MARKSRMRQPAPVRSAGKSDRKVYKTALYARLSAEREDTRERGTIQNQINFIRHYVEQQEDMEIYDTYMDDDISGTRFDRPAFERMMSDMRNGRIDCIVVKDLSRLGRDYIETGNLIERVFPMFRLRFVAVNDQFDSTKGGAEMIMTVTNIANALYAQDISKKIATAKENQMKQGIPCSMVPYGYRVEKSAGNDKSMVPDEESAGIVKRIFEEVAAGTSQTAVAEILNKEGIPTPYQYRMRNNPEKLAEKPHLKWNRDHIAVILKNEVYLGRYVSGKDKVCLYRHEKRHTADKEQWNVFENHHEPLVTEQLFETANARKEERKQGKCGVDNFFKRKIFCGCCGSGMVIRPEKKYRCYICTRKRQYGKDSCNCLPVKMDMVYDTVFLAVKEQIKLLLDTDALLRQMNQSREAKEKIASFSEALNKCHADLQKVAALKSGLYADYQQSLLSEKEYLQLNEEYSGRIEKLEHYADELAEAMEGYRHTPMRGTELRKIIEKYRSKRKLSKEMVEELVERVIVHEDKSMEIVFRYDDEMKKLLMAMEQRKGEIA
ncbi:MAG: recombinase family protein [Lachnospiraceae bacterium]|nr:recombinase family protein [Lachnospiraceae bacterium]